MSIHIKNINKQFDKFNILKNINLDIKSGELTALLGPSGSGKTTLLRIISGLEKADSGEIILDGDDASKTSVKDRKVGFVFQHYALFENMTIFDNIAFGLKVRRKRENLSKEYISKTVNDLLKLVHLQKFCDRYPNQLSGGQRQRVALSRALAVKPKFLLLDEPFGALDEKVRQELRIWLRRLHQEIDITTIFVTHDQAEAMEVANKIVIMNNGNIEQHGTAHEVYNNPKNLFTYSFLGQFNKFKALEQKQKITPTLSYNREDADLKKNLKTIFSRPYEIDIFKNNNKERSLLECKIMHSRPMGLTVSLELESIYKENINAEITRDDFINNPLEDGETIFIGLKNFRLFEK
jgi:sulfate transport system ATP-binding protein